MVEKNDVAAVLELIRPSLQADGGDVKRVERILKERVPGVTRVVPAMM